jgi:hypothetical protein
MGASWIMMSISRPSETHLKYSKTASSSTFMVAPKKGGMSMTREAPISWARRLRSRAMRELKWLVVTHTGILPAVCSMVAARTSSRSSSVKENCSE